MNGISTIDITMPIKYVLRYRCRHGCFITLLNLEISAGLGQLNWCIFYYSFNHGCSFPYDWHLSLSVNSRLSNFSRHPSRPLGLVVYRARIYRISTYSSLLLSSHTQLHWVYCITYRDSISYGYYWRFSVLRTYSLARLYFKQSVLTVSITVGTRGGE